MLELDRLIIMKGGGIEKRGEKRDRWNQKEEENEREEEVRGDKGGARKVRKGWEK